MVAFDYTTQEWKQGREGTELRLKQLLEEQEIVIGPEGADYCKLIGKDHTTLRATNAAAIRQCRADLA